MYGEMEALQLRLSAREQERSTEANNALHEVSSTMRNSDGELE